VLLACGVSTNSGTPRNVRSSFPLSNKVQGQPERLDIQQGGHGIAICADLLATVAPQLEAELAQKLTEKTFGEQAKGILKQLLGGKCPGAQDLARELHVSARTLRRRLTDQGLSFQRLLGEARRELARHYLLHSSMELNETAQLRSADMLDSPGVGCICLYRVSSGIALITDNAPALRKKKQVRQRSSAPSLNPPKLQSVRIFSLKSPKYPLLSVQIGVPHFTKVNSITS
jgi:AraC-like DNA-binding protein